MATEEFVEIEQRFDLFEDFYILYRELFPDEDESETRENIRKYLELKNSGFYGNNEYYVYLYLIAGEICGFLIGDYYENPRTAFIEFIGVKPSKRGTGLGKKLVKKFEGLLLQKHQGIKGIFIEVEKIETSSKYTSIPFWGAMGFKRVKMEYVQPPLSEGKHEAANLMLAFKGTENASCISTTLVLNSLKHYFTYAMNIQLPGEQKAFQKVSKALKDKEFIDLETIRPVN